MQTEDSLVDILLKFHRIVKGALGFEHPPPSSAAAPAGRNVRSEDIV
jgi:hypothetical protein